MSNSATQAPQVKRARTMYDTQGHHETTLGTVEDDTAVIPPVEDISTNTVGPPQLDAYAADLTPMRHGEPYYDYPGGPSPMPMNHDVVAEQGGVRWMGWLVLFFSFFGFGPVGVLLGHIGLRDMKRNRREGSRGWLRFTTFIAYLGSIPYMMAAVVITASLFGF